MYGLFSAKYATISICETETEGEVKALPKCVYWAFNTFPFPSVCECENKQNHRKCDILNVKLRQCTTQMEATNIIRKRVYCKRWHFAWNCCNPVKLNGISSQVTTLTNQLNRLKSSRWIIRICASEIVSSVDDVNAIWKLFTTYRCVRMLCSSLFLLVFRAPPARHHSTSILMKFL